MDLWQCIESLDKLPNLSESASRNTPTDAFRQPPGAAPAQGRAALWAAAVLLCAQHQLHAACRLTRQQLCRVRKAFFPSFPSHIILQGLCIDKSHIFQISVYILRSLCTGILLLSFWVKWKIAAYPHFTNEPVPTVHSGAYEPGRQQTRWEAAMEQTSGCIADRHTWERGATQRKQAPQRPGTATPCAKRGTVPPDTSARGLAPSLRRWLASPQVRLIPSEAWRTVPHV